MRRTGWWTLFVVLIAVLLFDALFVIVAVVDTAQGTLKGGLGPAITVIVLFLLIGLGLVALARLVEHHVRLNHNPVGGRWGVPAAVDGLPFAHSSLPSATPPATVGSHESVETQAEPGPETIGGAVVPEWHSGTPRDGYRRRLPRRVRHHSPVGKAVSFLVLAAIAIGFPVFTVVSFANWRTSMSIQDHGKHSTLIVEQVVEVEHSSRSRSYHTVNLRGTLVTPVDGQSQATVYTPHDDLYTDGESVAVVVDPSNPSHAELPGQPQHSVGGFVVLLVFTFIIYVFVGWIAFVQIRARRRRRSIASH